MLLLCEFAGFWFGTVHFDARRMERHGEPPHLMAVPRVREEIAACAKAKPVFLTGDWNATPDEPFLAEMRKFMKILSDERLPTNGNLKRCIDYVAVDSARQYAVLAWIRHVKRCLHLKGQRLSKRQKAHLRHLREF
ncbi:MAG: hypothetical protein IJ658_09885 [Kiritimatiellae bacterium]|nr:hypothetical protein [Kiritimatiellia bacterium]